ncbi:S9 family peptidase [Pseudobacteriovorax antillogorgiicola]|uniref:Oligopeptidase B n=1 Tax=Pseudobacteriovorax antillogorgiicola TaxID=1513793 RepID=A0A1Y6BLR1_9BACT|nr:S9 family peptidase [Pseudobacteriovorax antillogorgiicola]TCS55330.1 oligopeptidase B [Pseudobacteriovorax antillogorgiicola]SMF14075.1 oligopeptidase B [Pseudobacteriovorax antillogorgiicola]
MRQKLLALTSLLCLSSGIALATISAPKAPQKPKELIKHGDKRIDPYYWLNERQNPDVIAYLNAENDFTEAHMSKHEALQDELFNEMKSRIKKADSTAPYYDNGYFYYTRTREQGNYRLYCRKKSNLNQVEEIMLDVDKLSQDLPYTSVYNVSVSPNNQLLGYAHDKVGRRIYSIYFKDLKTGKMLPQFIENVTGNFVWANDSKTLFYTKQDPQTLRFNQVFRYSLDTGKSQLVFEEKDEAFSVYVGKSVTNRYILAESVSTETTETRWVSADSPKDSWTIFHPRKRGLRYEVFDGDDRFFVLTNHQAKNYQLMSTPTSKTSLKYWKTVIKHQADKHLQSARVFKEHIILLEKKGGLARLKIFNRKNNKSSYIKFDDPAYRTNFYVNAVYDTNTFLYSYESMTTPPSIYSYNFDNKRQQLIKQKDVLGDFNRRDYTSKRILAPARDGAKIPVSIVYRRDLKRNGNNPTVLYGYGSYGSTVEPGFSSNRLSLLDRGFIFAIAHIRGGAMLGRTWYEDGKLLKKKNTFTDFIDVSEYLIRNKYTNSKKLYASGGSAGGLLMGAVINMRPDLYNGVIAAVPFVDVVTTMLDDSIPLTTGEYDEWGNPNNKEYYNYMKSYSPYDNVEAKEYPNLLVTTGFHDSQVQYWEPAKWVAKLRNLKKGDQLVLLKTNMDAGHGGASGRFNALKELAFDYSFIMGLEGIKPKPTKTPNSL